MSDLDDDVIDRPAEIPVLDRIVKPSKQKDLADLLIKIIQTNEAEDKASLTEYDVDVSSATLRDIDAKLSAALHSTEPEPTASIPMLTEIADFPVTNDANLSFRNGEDSRYPEAPALPAMHALNNDTDAANSAQQPRSANQECFTEEGIFSLADSDADAAIDAAADATTDATAQHFDLGLDTSLKVANQRSLLQEQLNQSSRQIIDDLIAEHAVAIRNELEIRIDSLRRELIGELGSHIAPAAGPKEEPASEKNASNELEGSDA